MNVLVTLNAAYISPLKVMLRSLFDNCSENVNIYLMHSDIKDTQLNQLSVYIRSFGHTLYPIRINKNTFLEAPVHSYYSKEMYYRLIAHIYLPDLVDKVLYLDPDILVITPVERLYNIELHKYYFAAAAHTKPVIDYINKIRLRSIQTSTITQVSCLLMRHFSGTKWISRIYLVISGNMPTN